MNKMGNDKNIVRPESITAIGIIMEDGLTLAAIRILYSGEIDAAALKAGDFQVPGRRVIHTYVNNSGKRGEIAQKGIYVFAELLVNEAPDSNEFKETTGNFKYDPRGGTYALELPLVVTVRQVNTGYSADGREIPPFSLANNDQYIEVVDEFIPGNYTDPETNITIRYRLFVPEGYRDKQKELPDLPVVLFLHGAGESGFDNRSQVSSYRQAQEYLKPEAQAENPCFVLMPQCPMTEERGRGVFEEFGWYTYIESSDGDRSIGDHSIGDRSIEAPRYTHPSKSLRATINTLINRVVPNYNIDSRRIYAAGHSMGAGGAIAALIERPDIFAAAVSFASAGIFSDEMLERIKNKPFFFTMAEDESVNMIKTNMPSMMDQLEHLGVNLFRCTGHDAWNGILRGREAEAEARRCIERAKEQGASMIYVEFMKGTIVEIAHWSHRASFENAEIRRWLFRRRLDQRGVTATFKASGKTVDDLAWNYLEPPDFNDRNKFITPCRIVVIGKAAADAPGAETAVTVLRIEYSGDIAAGVLQPEHFRVPCCGINRVYVNSTGKCGEEAVRGAHVFLELDAPYKGIPPIAVRQIDTRFNDDRRIIPPFNRTACQAL
ncbi:hypothetical protein FACS1894151_04220 [Spirochaetia bacterium]|nr:hypothetical protein FACS1894151_04220 [Spirochaetia bacterium]